MMKNLQRRVLQFLVPPLGALLMRAIYVSCKKEFHIPNNLPQEPFIVAFWHGELFMQPFLYKRVRPSHKIAVMISEHFDGELIARTIEHFGFESIRGSSKKGGARVLISAIKRLKEGYDIAITPDGPRGPRYSVASGIIALSQKTGAKIVPFSYRADSYWQLGSWDRFVIPKPFSKLSFFVGEPFDVEGMSEKEAKAFIKERMLQYSQKVQKEKSG